MKPIPKHYDPSISLIAIREELDEAGIYTSFDKGETYGCSERKVFLDVAGYVQVYMNGDNPAYAFFDIVSWDNDNSDGGKSNFASHIRIRSIDITAPNSLQTLSKELIKLIAASNKWKNARREPDRRNVARTKKDIMFSPVCISHHIWKPATINANIIARQSTEQR